MSVMMRKSVVLDRSRTYTSRILSTQPNALLAYWRLGEPSLPTIVDSSGKGRHGTYGGVDLGQPGIGDGTTAPFFDGAADYADVYSASLAGAFNGQEGTFVCWCKVSGSGVWTDTTTRRIVTLQVDASNRVLLQKTTANNTINWFYQAGGTTESVNKGSVTTTDWFHVALTWSKTADQMQPYFNGVAEGAAQTTLGTFTGTISNLATTIGALSSGGNFWSGWIAHAGLWSVPLSAGQIATLATV